MKKISIICSFSGGVSSPYHFYVDSPEPNHSPIHFQEVKLSQSGGSVPREFKDGIEKVMAISINNNIPFGDLLEHLVKTSTGSTSSINENNTTKTD